jgi:integrase
VKTVRNLYVHLNGIFELQWTTSNVYGSARGRSPETVVHSRERTSAFVDRCGDRLLRSIDREIAYEWLADDNRWTIPALRAMFNDAERAGKIDRPPFNKLRLAVPTRVGRRLPARADIDRMHSLADELTPPSFAAYLFTVGWQGIRPGEGDALRWDRVDFDAGTLMIDQQWSAKGARFKEPKHGSTRKLPIVPVVRDRLLELPRESEFVFTTLRGSHYTPSSRNHHWNRVRCSLGLPDVELYLATRHFFVTYAVEELELSVEDVGWYCGHRGAGAQIVRDHYLHPDDNRRRERIAERFKLLELENGQRSLDAKRARRLHSI